MAGENHDGIAEMLLSLQENEDSSTLLPTLTSHANENYDQSSDPKPDVNLQLSLGGFYDKADNSAPTLLTSFANPGNSVLKRSYFEQNNFMQNEAAEIKREVQVVTNTKNQDGGSSETYENDKSKEVKPLLSDLDIPVWAAQSAYENPALQRALNVIKSEGGLRPTPISTNWMGDTSKRPHATEGFGPRVSILYQARKNGNSIATHISYGTNQRSAMPQNQNLNLFAPANSSGASGHGNFNQPMHNVNFVSPFNCSLATMSRLPNWTAGGSLIMRAKAAAFFPSTPAPFGPRANNIPIMPQNNGAGYHNQSDIPSNFLPNSKVPPFVPVSSSTNANGISFMPREPNQPFAGSGVTPIPLSEVINGSRAYHNSINASENPYKRAKYDNRETVEPKLELMKQMPTVVTTGGNPNGNRIEGLLYEYGNNQEVIIVCACHGCSFSPEGFVRHGGVDVENPKQQISVLGYPDYLRK